jgi:hypothetical protein
MVVRFNVEDDAGKKKDLEARMPSIVTVNKTDTQWIHDAIGT